MYNIYSPRTVQEILKKYDLFAKKSLGQNFLVDKNIAEKIVASAKVTSGETVVEIGPGLGALTRALALRAGHVVALELDKKIIPILREVTSDLSNITIHHGDAVKEDFDALVTATVGKENMVKGYKVVANLPYYATTPIIMHLFEQNFNIRQLVVMVQREVAERIVAKPGGKQYGSLSVVLQFFAKPVLLLKVPPTVFFPKPEVESAVIGLDVYKEPPVSVSNRELFFKVVRAAFGKRRKTIVNSLVNSPLNVDKNTVIRACELAGINPSVRAEKLSITQFAQLYEYLKDLAGTDGEGDRCEI